MKHFFISYNKADRRWAEWIGWQLEEAGYSIVIQAWDFRPGMDFVEEMERAANDCERTIAVLSPDYLGAEYSKAERRAAFADDPSGEKRKLVPVRVRECEIPRLIAARVYIDLVDKDHQQAKVALLDGVRLGRAKPDQVEFPGEQPVPAATAERQIATEPRFPNSLPAIENIPHRRNPNFTGRQELLDDLHAALAAGQTAAVTQAIPAGQAPNPSPNTQTLHGQGGVGKTQLAVEYLHRHADLYDVAWWIRCEEPSTRLSDLAVLARPLNLPEAEAQEQEVVVKAVQRWLGLNDRWLLVLDNVVAPEDVDSLLPVNLPGHVIVTSRNPNWRGRAQSLAVDVFTREESVKYLLGANPTNRHGTTIQDQAELARVRGHAGELAAELGDLPLALAQAAAYVEETGVSLERYLKLFRDRRRELWATESPPPTAQRTVAETFSLALDRLRLEAEQAESLLNLAAFLAAEDIPRDLLGRHVEDELELTEAPRVLRRYSLADVGPEHMSVHRLVQAVCRDRLDDEQRSTCVEMAVQLVNDSFPGDDVLHPSGWPVCAKLLPHALAALDQFSPAAERTETADAAARLVNQVGLYQEIRLEFAAAEQSYQRSLAIYESVHGPKYSYVATALNNLAQLLQATNRLAEAEPLMRRALSIFEQSFGTEHPNVAVQLNNLAQLLKATNRLADAEPLSRRMLEILELFGKLTGHEHPHWRTAKRNYAGILTEQDWREADIEQRLQAITQVEGPLAPIEPEIERMLGPAQPFDEVLAALDQQYRSEGRPPVYFLKPEQPIAPHLDELLGSAKSVEQVLKSLNAQYRQEGRPDVWFLPLDEPISPHLDELLGPMSEG